MRFRRTKAPKSARCIRSRATGKQVVRLIEEQLTPRNILTHDAFENAITLHNADQIKAKIVAEAGNGPTTPHADEILSRKGIFVIPDILANAGGVTVSYFEWAQDLQGFFWQVQEVNSKLEFVMRRAFNDVHETMRKFRERR